MRLVVKLPKVGDVADEVLISSWYAHPGEHVHDGEPLLRVETGKAEIDIPAPASGVLTELLVAEGDEVSIGTSIAVIEA